VIVGNLLVANWLTVRLLPYLEELTDLRKKAVPNLEKRKHDGCIRSLCPEAVESLEMVEGAKGG
jgi:hypothetical protein